MKSSNIQGGPVFLITYADSFNNKDEKTLKTLQKVSDKYLKCLSGIHLLPFYPYTSDRGFSVKDYSKVKSDFGSWNNVKELSKNYDLMFDAVINHISSESEWFQKAIKGEKYKNYFISYDKVPEHSKVFRPRNKPLFTKYGDKYYWTTFSSDQIDLNFKDEGLKQEIKTILELYQEKGSKYLRLDAIAYLIKDPKKKSINEKGVFKLIEEILPKDTIPIAELNLPNTMIKQYKKKMLAYNFPLPPLVYHAFLTENNKILYKFLKKNISENNFNYLASHDGIGLIPAKEFLKEEQINLLIEDVNKKGFGVSFGEVQGKKIPYELNINYLDALDRDETKFLCAHSLLLSLQGIPAIYYHSFFGSFGNKNYSKDYLRGINRDNVSLTELEKRLGKDSVGKRIYHKMCELLECRNNLEQFGIDSCMKIKRKGSLIIIFRGKPHVKCIHNFSLKVVECCGFDLLTKREITQIEPFGYVWLK